MAGAIAKFNRAKEHFDALRMEVDAFVNSDPPPFSSVGAFDTETWEWVERFQIREPLPLRFGVIFGDCVHNLRSCLDHVMWQVTLLDGGQPDKRTQFPIESRSEARFEEVAARYIPGLSAKHREMVKRVQPYHLGPEASTHPLAVVRDLSNTDKHQVLNAAFTIVGWDAGQVLDRLAGSYQGSEPSPVVAWYIASEGPLRDGEPWFRFEWTRDEEPPSDVKLGGLLRPHLAFGDPGIDAHDFPKLAENVRKIMQAFQADFPETEWIDEPRDRPLARAGAPTREENHKDSSMGAVFPAERVDTRFVIAMSMAKNDVERALRDALRARKKDDPDFSYRVRLVTGHLVEALDALNQYAQNHEDVRKLMARVPPEAQQHLKTVRSTLQKAGSKVLDHVRDNTFHYPSPDPRYNPTSDQQLCDALHAMADKRAEVFADFKMREVTLTFADDIALALALGKHSTNENDLRRQLTFARDGAIAFRAWAEALGVAYFEANNLGFGAPEPKDPPSDEEHGGD